MTLNQNYVEISNMINNTAKSFEKCFTNNSYNNLQLKRLYYNYSEFEKIIYRSVAE